jgi:hypothetical protein
MLKVKVTWAVYRAIILLGTWPKGWVYATKSKIVFMTSLTQEVGMKISSIMPLMAVCFMTQACSQLPINGAAAEPNYDVVKVAAVERHALRNNVQVIWINYPQARKK